VATYVDGVASAGLVTEGAGNPKAVGAEVAGTAVVGASACLGPEPNKEGLEAMVD
jgi:hypothetical protein